MVEIPFFYERGFMSVQMWFAKRTGNKLSKYRSRGGVLPFVEMRGTRFSRCIYFVCDFGSEYIHFVSVSLSFPRCLKRKNDAHSHLYSRCKVWVTRNANINCHYEMRWKEARLRGKEINLLVCQNAFSFLGLKLISLSHTNRMWTRAWRVGRAPKKKSDNKPER